MREDSSGTNPMYENFFENLDGSLAYKRIYRVTKKKLYNTEIPWIPLNKKTARVFQLGSSSVLMLAVFSKMNFLPDSTREKGYVTVNILKYK